MYKSLLLLFLLFANSAYANIEEIINRLQPYFPSINAEQINESQLDGFYEVIITEPWIEVMYISSDARYVLQGNCDRFSYNVQSFYNENQCYKKADT